MRQQLLEESNEHTFATFSLALKPTSLKVQHCANFTPFTPHIVSITMYIVCPSSLAAASCQRWKTFLRNAHLTSC